MSIEFNRCHLRCSRRCWWLLAGVVICLIVLMGFAASFIATHDLSPVARLFCSKEKAAAIDALRAEGVHVFYLRYHYRRNGWKVVCVDDPSMTDERLIGLAPYLRILEPSVLFLRKTNVGDAGIAHLEGISSVRFLDLGWTRAGDAGAKSIGTMPLLKELYLNNTNVSDATLPHLESLANLELLCVGESRVTQQGIAEFAQKAKHVHIDDSSR